MTLNSLTAPCFHEAKGCQFNYYELDEQIQTQLQQDESKQFICPVCHIQGTLRSDVAYLINEIKDENNQFIVEKSNQQILRMQKQSFTYSVLSEQQNVLELQKQFNSKILNGNKLSLEFIQRLNTERNNDIFQIFRKSQLDKIPTLIGIINFKLILFYHFLKIKLEFDIYDNTNKKNCIKIDNQDSDYIKIKQVILINNFIYLIIQQENLSQLYRGSINQIFEENEPIFYITELDGYTLLGESRLIQYQKHLLMIGSEASLTIEDQIKKNVEMNEDIKIPYLNETTQLALIYDQQIYLVDQESIDMKGRAYLQEFNISEQKISQLSQNIFSVSNFNIDFSLAHDNILYLFNSQNLNEPKAQVKYILSSRDNVIQTKIFNVINHHSYLKVKIIPTTKQKVGIVSCVLVGLMFQNSQTIFPGVLVFNQKDNQIEIELI
ncbi:unnamed protein product [Paramecium pentaurelia]|uniref:Uncharacterized protein n=1 Tax=Paramecium pentaurelia TaxID=43138 RepID=A0A8S1UY44_9CILI|nr:unnamed protein product [Paramecium pentaurelia]